MAKRIKFVETLKREQVEQLAQMSRDYVDLSWRYALAGVPLIPYNGLMASPSQCTPEDSFDLVIGVA